MNTWDEETKKTSAMLRAPPAGQYDFRPDPGGRSLRELAWHLAENEAYSGFSIERGAFEMDVRPPGIERPKMTDELAPGYERVHAEAMQKVGKLTAADLDRKLTFFTGNPMTSRQILSAALLHHEIQHRGQLSVLCRLGGGAASGAYGPSREEMAKFREKA